VKKVLIIGETKRLQWVLYLYQLNTSLSNTVGWLPSSRDSHPCICVYSRSNINE